MPPARVDSKNTKYLPRARYWQRTDEKTDTATQRGNWPENLLRARLLEQAHFFRSIIDGRTAIKSQIFELPQVEVIFKDVH